MLPSIQIGSATVPGADKELRLFRRGDEFWIDIPGQGELMNSRVHGSEEALARLACERINARKRPRVLIGGLGMGFTLAAALQALGPQAGVIVAELVPEVVDWNRSALGEPSGHPLSDPRSAVYIGDVGDLLRQRAAFDAILLDVDNGPEALIRRENDWLYSVAGLGAARGALRPGGVLAVWSAGPNRQFSRRLHDAGFDVEEHAVRARRPGKGARHHIWLAGSDQSKHMITKHSR